MPHGVAVRARRRSDASGYAAADSRCLLERDCVQRRAVQGRRGGMLLDAGRVELERLKTAGVVGRWRRHPGDQRVGVLRECRRPVPAGRRPRPLPVQVQTEHDQLVSLAPMLEASGARIPDRPLRTAQAGGGTRPGGVSVRCSGWRARGRALVKLSGRCPVLPRKLTPFADTRPYLRGVDRGVHPGRLHVEVGLASCRAEPRRVELRTAPEARRSAAAGRRRAAPGPCGHAAAPLRVRSLNRRRASPHRFGAAAARFTA